MSRFLVGDAVVWTSQAQGYSRQKQGVIVSVVAPNERPDRNFFPDLYKGSGCGFGRDHESYVVRVKNRHYWPRASSLVKAGPTTEQRLAARLARIAQIIESADHRAMAADGPVTKTRDEMTDDEFRQIYQLAKGGA